MILGAVFISGIFGLFFLAIAIAVFVFWLMMLIDCIKNPGLSSNERIVWVLVIVLLNWLGALIYMLAGRKK